MKIHMILLMAGFSKRFGENKLLYKIDGKPMYRYIAEVLTAVLRDQAETVSLTAVTQHEAVRSGLKEMGIPVLWNPHSERGISSSLQIGLDSLWGISLIFKRRVWRISFRHFLVRTRGLGACPQMGGRGIP